MILDSNFSRWTSETLQASVLIELPNTRDGFISLVLQLILGRNDTDNDSKENNCILLVLIQLFLWTSPVLLYSYALPSFMDEHFCIC